MDFRNYKNIIPYGFLLFLIISGCISIFNREINSLINSLAIPVFLFSVSILLNKSNSIIRKEIYNRIKHTELLIETDKGDEPRKSLENTNKFIIMTKKFIRIDRFTRALNIIATICFCLCLLSLMNIIQFPANCGYINIFSLALVFFDFFVLDDIIDQKIKTSIDKMIEEAKENTQKSLSTEDNE